MHRLSSLRILRNKVSQAVGLRPIPTPAWPLQDECDAPEIMEQLQSPLFGTLSVELRILIYSAVLGDPGRFLHICLNRKKKKCRPMAHWRCTDLESPFPTWQHYCFGEKPSFDKEGKCCNVHPRQITTTDDQLIALLLSCQRIYSEALIILYERNIFHFRGGVTLPAFKQSIPAVQWNAIRKIHLSTAYSPFYHPNCNRAGYKAPKTLPNWNQICEDLSSLPSLQTLSFDILADDPYFVRGYFTGTEPETLLSILKPLKAIRSSRMEVELNIELPKEVVHLLGPVNYEIAFRERPFNEVFRRLPLRDSIELEKYNLTHNL
ncbi:hypothetical protein K458DRAFT_385719 [Lentithecium fluviatile CBS 122367]|uniref:DUF7730 domain-containing protein n=1 Tax=Lentithecium fluviatile CBS 122367 TaxID=1168545 RepID=A0A6G1JDD9_9PLEO|nr:hypothetical protein K458DRAFT_385719 [Lentithecium fluviatile CBS 122367]